MGFETAPTPLYVVAGAIGGVLFVGQLLMSFVGLGADGLDLDVETPDGTEGPELGTGDGVGAWLLGLFSFRSVAAAAAVFGAVGYGLRRVLDPVDGLLLATAAGVGTLWFVTWLFRQLFVLENDGTVSARDTLGRTGTVYLPIPAVGEGKVTVAVGERTLELLAAGDGGPIPSGTAVTVTEVLDDRRVRVTPKPN